MYLNILFAYLFNLCLTSIIHYIAYYRATSGKADIIYTKFFLKAKNDAISKVIVFYLKFFISPDYWSAYSIKKNISEKYNKDEKDILGKFIKESNSYNFIFSIIVIIIYKLISNDSYFIKYIIIFRVVSRSFEIMFAFYNDVIDKNEKASNLDPTDRLRLATRSYFETIINYTLVYFIINNKKMIDNFFKSIGISTFTKVDFNGDEKLFIYTKIFILLQLFTSICLVYFALAKYIGDKQNDS